MVVAAGLLAIWLAHTPPTLSSPSDVLTAAGRLAGLAAGYTAALLVVLVARIPVLETGLGSDRLTRWHSRLGRYTVCLVAAHGVLIVTGYALADRVSPLRQFDRMVASYPYFVPAVAAGLGLVAVGVLSARAAMRRIGYQRWHLTHLATYALVGLAFGHQVTEGADFVYDRPARLAWTALWVSIAVCVAVFRVGLPLAQAARQRFRIHEVTVEGPDVVSLKVHGRRLDRFKAEPGQFVRVRALSRSGWWQSHPFSLSAPVSPPLLRITVKTVGANTRALQRLTPGTKVLVTGPFGSFTARRRRGSKVLLVAAGIGIAPLRNLFETIPAERLTLVYRHRDQAPVFVGELAAIAERRGANLVRVTDRAALTARGLSDLVPDLPDHDVFVCGPTGFMRFVEKELAAAGVPRRAVHRESFDLVSRPEQRWRVPALALTGSAACAALLVAPRLAAQPPAARGVVAAAPTSAALASSGGKPGTEKVMGPAERTLFATVQVEAVFTSGRLTGVIAVSLPDLDARSREISAMAAPILRREALAAGNANIHVVSGATYTSGAYAESLQGAIDTARGGAK